MADDDLDLFLQLAEEAEESGNADQQQGAGEEDDLDLFLQLAEEDGAAASRSVQPQGEPGPAPSAASQQQQQQQQQRPEAPARAGRQERLSGWAAPKAAPDPGVIPPSRPDVPLQQLQQPRAQQAFQITAFQQPPRAGQALGPGGTGRLGVFKDIEQGSIIERLSGLKIKNPLVSSAQVKARLADASVVKLSQVRTRHRTTGLEGAWATLCVVGEKSKPRESQSGRPYSIWKVTDLDATSHSLFLFGAAHGDLWKESVGTLVALFAPKVKTDGDFALSVDSPEQVWVLGAAKEFGYCKANKKNGEPCRMPVNAARCPYCPYHVQSEYNKIKPTRRNEFQETNIKTAFRPGMQRGLPWQPGQFAGEGPRTAGPRLPVLPQARLESAAEAARDKGSSTGARYLKTVANPAAAAAACQEREVLALRLNRLGPGEPPIPLPRTANVVIPTRAGTAGAAAGGRAGSGSGRGGIPAKRKAAEAAGWHCAAGGGGDGAGAAVGRGGMGGMMLLEVDLFEEDDARRRAIEMVRSMGGAPAPDPNNTRRTPAPAQAEAQRLKAARLSDSQASPSRRQHYSSGSGAGDGPSGGAGDGHGSGIGVSPLLELGYVQGQQAGPPEGAVAMGGGGAAPAGPNQQQRRQQQQAGSTAAAGPPSKPSPAPATAGAAAAQVGRLGGMLYNPVAAASAAATGAAAAAAAAGCMPPQPCAAAAAVAARGYQPPLAAPASQDKKGQSSAPGSRASIMSKLGIQGAGAGSGGGAGGSKGAASAQQQKQQQKQQQQSKSAFEAAFGSVIEEMERTAGAQTSSRYKTSVDAEDEERIDKVLRVLEQKDEMAQKMDSVRSLKVQAFRCSVCNYTSERRHPECAAHPHAVERIETTKRWWECEHCKYRFASVGARYPSKRCAKCQHPQTDFKAVSMYRPARQFEHEQVAVASRDKLVARGVEQKWVNS